MKNTKNKYLYMMANLDIRHHDEQYVWLTYELFNKIDKDKIEFLLKESYYNKNEIKSLKEENKHIIKSARLDYSKPLGENFVNYAINPNKSLLEELKNIDLTNIKYCMSWVNNNTLRDYLKANGIRTIFNELGCLRGPLWKESAYFDFSGVNYDTDFDRRLTNFLAVSDKLDLLSIEELINLVKIDDKALEIYRDKSKKGKVGVALQVSDDTNTLGYGKGFSATDIINYTVKKHGFSNTLVRNHPKAPLDFKHGDVRPVGDFFNAVDEVVTINSSASFEAVLLGKYVRAYGHSPFSTLFHFKNTDFSYSDKSIPENNLKKILNFAIISYLIPKHLLFDEAYYEYRLNTFCEIELFNKGLQNWKNAK